MTYYIVKYKGDGDWFIAVEKAGNYYITNYFVEDATDFRRGYDVNSFPSLKFEEFYPTEHFDFKKVTIKYLKLHGLPIYV